MTQAILHEATRVPLADAGPAPHATELREVFHRILTAARRAPAPTYEERMEHLGRLARSIKTRTEEIVGAVRQDFGSRSAHETKLAEVLMLLDAIRLTPLASSPRRTARGSRSS